MWKIIGYIFLGIIVIAGVVGFMGLRKFNKKWFQDRPSDLSISFQDKAIDFEWASSDKGDVIEPYVAMMVPTELENSEMKFRFQFDTGASFTMIYGLTLESLQNLGLDFEIIEKEGKRYVKKINCVLGSNKVEMKMVQILEGYGNRFEEIDTLRNYKIGTIGSDMLDKRTTVIDFKNQYIQFYKERPSDLFASEDFHSFSFQGRRIMLPVIMDKKDLAFYFDTGCSAFGLITSKYRFNKYTERDSAFIKYSGNRFGESLPIIHKNSAYEFGIAGKTLPLVRISYIDKYARFQRFVSPFTRIGGWLGNQPFIDKVMVIDTKAEQFAIYEDERDRS